jgi:hypothetical protein
MIKHTQKGYKALSLLNTSFVCVVIIGITNQFIKEAQGQPLHDFIDYILFSSFILITFHSFLRCDLRREKFYNRLLLILFDIFILFLCIHRLVSMDIIPFSTLYKMKSLWIVIGSGIVILSNTIMLLIFTSIIMIQFEGVQD